VRKDPKIVLKFGGSVLLDEQRLRIAVHEIYRWRREGWRVVAVVSALSGRTDELVNRCAKLASGVSDAAKARVIASGEQECAALLGVHLDRAGIPARVLTPAVTRFVAEGPPLNADPVSIQLQLIEQGLEADGVVVFAGFIATDDCGQSVTLGRGGSDLSAIFLADALGADRCRLIKDVDGLYESDPSKPGPRPKRYAHASYEDALSTDGSVLQRKAMEYAQRRNVPFEVGRFNGIRPTSIGAGETAFTEERDTPVPLRVALCGLGTVGGGVLELLTQLPEHFEVVGAACRDPSKRESLLGTLGSISDDAVATAGLGADVVVETIGGIDTAALIAECALNNQSDLVTANKALIADRGDALNKLAAENDRVVFASASVGGGTPVLEALKGRTVHSVRGVLNGTGNFVLGAVGEGCSLDDAVRTAQELGFAEADPSRDLDGRDAMDKLLVIAGTLGWSIPESEILCEPIDESNAAGGCVRHVGSVNAGSARVSVESVDPSEVFGRLRNEWNAAIIELEDGSSVTVRGKGAGRWPTSESVLADLLELSRMHAAADPAARSVEHA